MAFPIRERNDFIGGEVRERERELCDWENIYIIICVCECEGED